MKNTPFQDLLVAVQYYNQGAIGEEEVKAFAVAYLSQDKEIIPNMLALLNYERKENKELVTDLNVALSLELTTRDFRKSKSTQAARQHIFEQAKAMYQKWVHKIGPTAIIKGFEELEAQYKAQRDTK
jgi:hypothetical protein